MADENIEQQTTETTTPPPEVPLNERPVDGPGSGRGELRQQLEKSFEKTRKAEQKTAPKQPQRSRARQEAEEQEQEAAPATAEGEAEAPAEGEAPQTAAPEGWSREAKEVWQQLPPQVQAAVTKREEDMAKGVEQLKASHKDIDEALKPRLDVIRRHGHTPAQAVNQLFAWFEALGANPQAAFPALANSFKFDLRSLPGMQQGTQPSAQPAVAAPAVQPGQQPGAASSPQPQVDIPPYVKSLEQQIAELKQSFGQQIGALGTNFEQASQQKTEEILMNWAKDKPYFEDVRQMMGHLIRSGAVAPLANGSADLDKAYDMALYALPDIRNKVLADQQQKAEAARKAKADAEKKAQQEQADKARRAAAGSLTQGAPGSPSAGQPNRKKGKSVRESIDEARRELSE